MKKARYETEDEREEQVRTKAFHIGWIGASVVMLFLYIWRSIHDEPISDIFMILFAQNSAVLFYEYINIPEKKTYLVCGIISIIGFGLAFASLLKTYGIY
ncbi:MAG TPA: DUF6442 family protein [Oscillospiraceae bacterium]|nr:DUF6442 family protein [Oscillospiraceae bacterium]